MAKEYIERDKALEEFDEWIQTTGALPKGTSYYYEARGCIECVPAADVSEVENCENLSECHPVDEFICSSCGVIIRECSRYEIDEDTGDETCYEFKYRYCPLCGKKIVYEEAPGNE